MGEVLTVDDWIKAKDQFFFIDDSFDKVERIKDGSMFFVGDLVEYINESSQKTTSNIKYFESMVMSYVFMDNNDVVCINDIEWNEGFYKTLLNK